MAKKKAEVVEEVEVEETQPEEIVEVAVEEVVEEVLTKNREIPILHKHEAAEVAKECSAQFCELAKEQNETVQFVAAYVKNANCGIDEYILTANPDGTYSHGIAEG